MKNIRNYPIIDFHAHVFPDKIAEKAVKAIGEFYGLPMSGKGTVEDLLEKGRKIQATKYIIHSSATNAEQVQDINDFIAGVKNSSKEFIGFGTLHPDFNDVESEMQRITALNLKGIKLHPEFQGFAIDDESMMKIYKNAEAKLPILMHMGDKKLDSSSPERLLRVIKKFPGLTIIAAHLGGFQMWKKSFELLAGKNIYFDTSSTLYFLEPDDAVKIIRKHGLDKIVFGTDYPMWNHENELKRFFSLDLNEGEQEKILWKNASILLGI